MLGKLVRVLFALTAVAPLSVSLAYVFAVKGQQFQWAAIAAFLCLLLGALSLWIVQKAREKLEALPIVIKKAKSADKEVIGFFVAYALPLLFKGDVAPDFGALCREAVGAAMRVGPGALVALTIAFPALLAAGASGIVRAITSPR